MYFCFYHKGLPFDRCNMDIRYYECLSDPKWGNRWTNLSKKDHGRNVLTQAKWGTFVLNANDMYISLSMQVYGEWGEEELDVLRDYIHPGGVVFDIGALMGTFTIPFAKLVGDKGLVFAFEPQQEMAGLIKASLVVNSLDNTMVIVGGAGAADSTMMVPSVDYNDLNNFGSVSLTTDPSKYKSSRQVRVQAMDGVMRNVFGSVDKKPVDLIKIDVEGMELDVIKGAKEIIKKHHPALWIEHNNPKETHVQDYLKQQHKYKCKDVYHNIFNVNNHNEIAANIWGGNIQSRNMLCTRGKKSKSKPKRDLENVDRVYVSI
eukprot:GFYU01046963.1.p1 GENE.GFYU01046963.1~~GFYU01046963.1.p1  ORF type:complete len:317 (-),score=76.30 GFYU01046963.1:31-981(-)